MEIAMINEHEFQQDLEATALPALDSCMHDGYMDPAVSDWHGHRLRTLHPADGTPNKLHVVRYDVEKFHALQIPGSSRQTHGTVLISHGFTEFAAKYKEMAWYFLLAGFSVCILEHRGHGYSARDVRNDQIVYIDTWHRYVADLAKCARTIARPMAADKPLVLFAHSMGGGIAAAMLERYPNIVDKAVLSSPMIEANLHTPNWLAALVCGAACQVHGTRTARVHAAHRHQRQPGRMHAASRMDEEAAHRRHALPDLGRGERVGEAGDPPVHRHAGPAYVRAHRDANPAVPGRQ